MTYVLNHEQRSVLIPLHAYRQGILPIKLEITWQMSVSEYEYGEL